MPLFLQPTGWHFGRRRAGREAKYSKRKSVENCRTAKFDTFCPGQWHSPRRATFERNSRTGKTFNFCPGPVGLDAGRDRGGAWAKSGRSRKETIPNCRTAKRNTFHSRQWHSPPWRKLQNCKSRHFPPWPVAMRVSLGIQTQRTKTPLGLTVFMLGWIIHESKAIGPVWR